MEQLHCYILLSYDTTDIVDACYLALLNAIV